MKSLKIHVLVALATLCGSVVEGSGTSLAVLFRMHEGMDCGEPEKFHMDRAITVALNDDDMKPFDFDSPLQGKSGNGVGLTFNGNEGVTAGADVQVAQQQPRDEWQHYVATPAGVVLDEDDQQARRLLLEEFAALMTDTLPLPEHQRERELCGGCGGTCDILCQTTRRQRYCDCCPCCGSCRRRRNLRSLEGDAEPSQDVVDKVRLKVLEQLEYWDVAVQRRAVSKAAKKAKDNDEEWTEEKSAQVKAGPAINCLYHPYEVDVVMQKDGEMAYESTGEGEGQEKEDSEEESEEDESEEDESEEDESDSEEDR